MRQPGEKAWLPQRHGPAVQGASSWLPGIALE